MTLVQGSASLWQRNGSGGPQVTILRVVKIYCSDCHQWNCEVSTDYIVINVNDLVVQPWLHPMEIRTTSICASGVMRLLGDRTDNLDRRGAQVGNQIIRERFGMDSDITASHYGGHLLLYATGSDMGCRWGGYVVFVDEVVSRSRLVFRVERSAFRLDEKER